MAWGSRVKMAVVGLGLVLAWGTVLPEARRKGPPG